MLSEHLAEALYQEIESGTAGMKYIDEIVDVLNNLATDVLGLIDGYADLTVGDEEHSSNVGVIIV